jgi:hypothetical protein
MQRSSDFMQLARWLASLQMALVMYTEVHAQQNAL